MKNTITLKRFFSFKFLTCISLSSLVYSQVLGSELAGKGSEGKAPVFFHQGLCSLVADQGGSKGVIDQSKVFQMRDQILAIHRKYAPKTEVQIAKEEMLRLKAKIDSGEIKAGTEEERKTLSKIKDFELLIKYSKPVNEQFVTRVSYRGLEEEYRFVNGKTGEVSVYDLYQYFVNQNPKVFFMVGAEWCPTCPRTYKQFEEIAKNEAASGARFYYLEFLGGEAESLEANNIQNKIGDVLSAADRSKLAVEIENLNPAKKLFFSNGQAYASIVLATKRVEDKDASKDVTGEKKTKLIFGYASGKDNISKLVGDALAEQKVQLNKPCQVR